MRVYFCDLQLKLYRHICSMKKQQGKQDSTFYNSLGTLTRYDLDNANKHKQMSR